MLVKFKVCLIGATRVGKTSLAARFVHSIFSDSYLTTIGVKIETHLVQCGERTVQLVIWDLSGEDEFQSVQTSYVVGSAGYLLVVDGTRRDTIHTAIVLAGRMREVLGDVPFVVVINKADLSSEWEIEPADLRPLEELAYAMVQASAKTGDGVARAFELLVEGILARVPEQYLETRWT